MACSIGVSRLCLQIGGDGSPSEYAQQKGLQEGPVFYADEIIL